MNIKNIILLLFGLSFFFNFACVSSGIKKNADEYELVNPESNANVKKLYLYFEEKLPNAPPGNPYLVGEEIFDALEPNVKADYRKAAINAAKYPKDFVVKINTQLSKRAFKSLFEDKKNKNAAGARYLMIEAIPKLAGIHWKIHSNESCLSYCVYLKKKGVLGGTNQMHASFYLYLAKEFSPATKEDDVTMEFQLKKMP